MQIDDAIIEMNGAYKIQKSYFFYISDVPELKNNNVIYHF